MENFQQFTKDTVKLHFDSETGISYVKKVQDKANKETNYKETDNEIITGLMPQILDMNGHLHNLCPM